MTRFFIFPLLLALLSLDRAGARTLEELEVAYEVRVLALEKEHREGLQKLNKGYLRALNGVQEKLQKGGRLDDVLIVVQEKKDLQEEKWPLPALEDSAPDDLIRVRKLYEKARVGADREHAAALIETAEKMEKLLAAKMKSLTRAGDIAGAKEAKNQLEALQNSAKIEAARDLIKRVRLNRIAPIAMRIRRSGDDLEVLVRYDKGGKVSLDSPVENVIELTGGKEEKGETTATVLGEFVGAKGYEVDSYVAFESDMDEITPPMRAISLELEPGFKIAEQRALRITMPTKAPNPRVEWPFILAPIKSASRIQIEFRYFIPAENKKLKGFALHYGLAAPIEGEVMDIAGRWTSQSLETESMNEKDTLRIYIDQLAGSNKTFNGENESIYLDDLKVTYLSFAAHLVRSYQDGKPAGEIADDPTEQRAIVLAGKLLSSELD